ncbi:MAG TPA: DUF262 domain-containing protein, partial [Thermoflexia bacterium]|nr:DUF262 domain-containing protein [Thermoflexia bacterium]
MVARIEAREKHLKDLFGDKFLFEIPEFQRQFSWEKENFEQLVEDIKDALVAFDGKEPYFLGSIILWTKESHADGSGLFAVIDGQQRLTSIVILMACLRDLCQDSEEKRELQDCIYQKAKKLKGTSERVRLKVRDREHDFFKQYILYPDGTKKIKEAASPGLNESKQHILQAVEVFYGTFTNEQGVLDYGLIERFTIYLLQKIVLVVVKTDSLASGFRLFNIINARGMPLSNADLLKSENLRMVPEQSRPRYTKIWEDIEEEIGVDNLEMLISFMRSIYLRKKAQKAIFEEFNEKIFKENSNLKGQKFIERLSTISELYQGKIEDTTIKVTDIGNEVYYHNLVSIMRDFLPFNDWMTALIGFVEKFKEDKLLFKYVVLLEKKIAVEWVIGRSFTQRLTQI